LEGEEEEQPAQERQTIVMQRLDFSKALEQPEQPLSQSFLRTHQLESSSV
jgi:hypothetical protein